MGRRAHGRAERPTFVFMRKFPGRLVNFTWDYMDVSRFGRLVGVRAHAQSHIRARARARRLQAVSVSLAISRAHPTGRLTLAAIPAIVLDEIVGGIGRGKGWIVRETIIRFVFLARS